MTVRALAAAALTLTALPAAAQVQQTVNGGPHVVCDGEPAQGGFLICTSANAMATPPLALNGDTPVPIEQTGYAFFPIARDATGELEVRGHGLDPWTGEIGAREFDIQRIDGLPPSKVTPRSEAEQQKVAEDAALKNKAWEHHAEAAWWMQGFQYPLEGEFRQSGVYGSQRILNGEEKNPHFGIDYAAGEGEAILSPANGEVVLANPDMYFEGGLVVVDHGQGVMSVFMHMSDIEVEAGMPVLAGQKLGEVGSTGRSTGAHLHWGLRVRDTYIDPALAMAFDPQESEILMADTEEEAADLTFPPN